MMRTLATGERPSEVIPERQLACDVIWSAMIDMVRNHPVRQKKERNCVFLLRCQVWGHTRSEAFQFLVGKTTISKFWFELAGVEPMTGTLDEIDTYLRENITNSGMKQLGGAA
jgi:hypothetical protein